MKKIIYLTSIILFLSASLCRAQLAKVNENCDSKKPCEKGLYCVTLKNGQKKCSECDQSTLNSMTNVVDEACKTCGEGWTTEKCPEYKDGLASDGRVPIEVYDIMLEKAKKCKQARINRENKCWNGGDSGHKREIEEAENSILNHSAHKISMIRLNNVFYCDKSTYQNKLNTFELKCNSLNFPNINQKLDIMKNEIAKGKKVDCSVIQDYSSDCERCCQAAKDLLYYGFNNTESKFPDEYNEKYEKSLQTFEKAKDLLSKAKSKSLCN